MTKRPAPKPRRPARSRPVSAPRVFDSIPLAAGRKAHPPIGLGLWGLGRWTAEDEARTKATIGRAYEKGIRWFDTAEVYGGGRSERILGEVLHRATGGADDAFVVTKVSWEHLRPAQVRASLINSLERLARRSVDLYLVHAPDPRVPLAETMPALEALWKEGKVGAIGVSNFTVDDLEAAAKHLSETRIAVNQVRYNLLDRDDGDPVREYCRSHGILLEAYTPLARGLLNGRYLDGQRIPANVRRLSERLLEPQRAKETLTRARAIRDLATEAGLSTASIALHWLRRQGAVPVFGASRPGQVDENLAAWATPPDEALLVRAEALARGDRA
ncbi:MAG: aldo/keto reductase [Thermoplasmata archaeon]